MTSFIVLEDKRIEVLDKQVYFEAGEKMFLEEEGKKKIYTITSIVKVLQCNGDKCDVIQEINVS